MFKRKKIFCAFLSTIIESERQKNEGLLISSCTKKDESFQWKSKVFRNFFKSKDGEIFSDRPPIAHDWSVAQNSEDWCQQISHFWLFEALLSLITNRFFSPLRKTQTETEHQQIQQYFIQIYSQKLDKMEMVFSKCDVFFCCWVRAWDSQMYWDWWNLTVKVSTCLLFTIYIQALV